MTKTEIKTLRDLRDALNNLTDEKLDMDAIIWGYGLGGEIRSLDFLEEDYINPSGEGVEPKSEYKDDPEYADAEIIYTEGTAILWVDYVTE